MTQPSVLLVSEDPDFARRLMARWQAERALPGFVVMAGEPAHAPMAAFNLAIVGPMPPGRLEAILAGLELVGRPVLHVFAEENHVARCRERFPQVVWLQQHEGWAGTTVVVAREMLRSGEAVERARRAEQLAGTHERDAALGRYIGQMRHGFNNALTSVLGNAELILLNPDAVPREIRDQIKTIQTMALRMHEMMQRLTSLEYECKLADERPEPSEATKSAERRGPRAVRTTLAH